MTSLSDALQSSYAMEFRAVAFQLPSGAALLSGLNLNVARGETLVLLGRSGSGKTTTLKLINRLLEPTEGEILIDGRPHRVLGPDSSCGAASATSFRTPGYFRTGLWRGMSAWCPRWKAGRRTRIRARVREMLELVGLPPAEFAQRRPSSSLGRTEATRGSGARACRRSSHPADGRAVWRARSGHARRIAERISRAWRRVCKRRSCLSRMTFAKRCFWERGSRCWSKAAWSGVYAPANF